MIALGLALLLQQAAPTVGDTVWVTRTLTVPAGWAVESRPWRPEGGALDALGPPRLRVEGNRATLRYPAVFWSAGPVEVPLPPVLLTGPQGQVDSAGPTVVIVGIASVLPDTVADSLLAPQPAVGMVPARRRRAWPPILAVLLVATGAALATWRRAQRGEAPTAAPPDAPARPPVEAWARAGEARAVAGAAAADLREAIARLVPAAHPGLDTEACLRRLDDARPGWPLGEIGRLLRELDVARFGPARGGREALVLHGEAAALAQRLADAGGEAG